MSVTSLQSCRTRMYEVFRIIHFGCSTAVCALLWIHIKPSNNIARVQAGLAWGMWTTTYVYRSCLIIYRNFARGTRRTGVSIHNVHNNVLVHARLARPWKVKPGQYVYLTTSRPGLLSLFQRHPFMIIESAKHDLEMMIQPQRGYTARLLRECQGSTNSLSALIEGPYGHQFDLRTFGTVVLFASGMGICGHLPYIQQLVKDHSESRTKTRDLLLIWSVDDKAQYDLVADEMNNILREDDLPLKTTGVEHRDGESYQKPHRVLGDSSGRERPGRRPKPHGQNVRFLWSARSLMQTD